MFPTVGTLPLKGVIEKWADNKDTELILTLNKQ
jgi:hypothetical protein